MCILIVAAMADLPLINALGRIAERYGTPTYAFDQRRLRAQAEKLRAHLPGEIEILYSLKANASLGICDVLAECGLGADVASAGELAIAVEAGFPPARIFVAGPYKSPETISQLGSLPEAVVSMDSASELETIARAALPNRLVLRLRPDFCSHAVCSAGSDSRFGVCFDELPRCRAAARSHGLRIAGFHVFAGSQVLQAEQVTQHLRGAMDLSCRAADALGITPELVNLGGGFGIPYGPGQEELDLALVGDELARLVDRAAPARIVLELGRYLVAQAGWYLTTVVGHQRHRGREAVVVDGGTHQRADMCGLGLRTKAHPPLVLDAEVDAMRPTDVLGCLSLPADVLAEAAALPPLSPGNVLAFANAGAYGVWSSPAIFHAYPLPAEVAFDAASIQLMRPRKPAQSMLDDQHHVADQTMPKEAVAVGRSQGLVVE
jgi:diaminopimelate decarboxylase